MGSISEPPVVLFDYQFAPNAQRARSLLTLSNIPFQVCEQPFVQPRPILHDLGITYRRIPVNAIGKDVYVDNRVFLEAVRNAFPEKSAALAVSPADHAYESFGYRTFWICLPLVPPALMSEAFLKDRAELFGVFARPDYETLRPSALAEFRALLDLVENDFLVKKWIGGDKCAIADIHASWMIKFALQTLEIEKEPGFSAKDFPKVHAWINGLPLYTDPNKDADKISADDAKQRLFSAGYSAKDIGVDHTDPTGLQAGTRVSVGTTDE